MISQPNIRYCSYWQNKSFEIQFVLLEYLRRRNMVWTHPHFVGARSHDFRYSLRISQPFYHWGHHAMAWWRHRVETISVLLAVCEGKPPVTDGFPSQRPMALSFDVSFDLRLNKRLSKQTRRRWSETLSCTLWHHYNGNAFRITDPLGESTAHKEPAMRFFNLGCC